MNQTYSISPTTIALACGSVSALALLGLGLGLTAGTVSLGGPAWASDMQGVAAIAMAVLMAIATVLGHAADQVRQREADTRGIGLVLTTGECASCGDVFPLVDLRTWLDGDWCADCYQTVAPQDFGRDRGVA